MSTPQPAEWKHLAPRPESLYRQLFIRETRIRARDLYGLHLNAEEPLTPEEIAAEYGLAVEAVHEAIAYCRSDPPEIRQDWEAEEALEAAMGMKDPDYRKSGKSRRLSMEEAARLSRP
jgi:uncharacterized protein (DUF433 family)